MASFQFWVWDFLVPQASGGRRLSSLCTLPLRLTPKAAASRRPPLTRAFQPLQFDFECETSKAAASTTFPVCRTPSGLAARLQVSDPKSMAGKPFTPGLDA